jgi:hypothetical protein
MGPAVRPASQYGLAEIWEKAGKGASTTTSRKRSLKVLVCRTGFIRIGFVCLINPLKAPFSIRNAY